MSKVKLFQLIPLVLIILSLMFPFIGKTSVKNDSEKRPDLIFIPHSEALKRDEMPAVGFLHDLHTGAVDGKCEPCHARDDKGWVFRFKRTTEAPSMELYHDNCTACHSEKKAAGEITGPDIGQCRSCHTGFRPEQSSLEKIRFSRSLHYIHEASIHIKGPAGPADTDEANCSRCHHKYSEETRKTYYAKGEEEACSYCHKADRRDDVRSIREASHDSCVACHQQLKEKQVEAVGPVSCEGCHDAEKLKIIRVLTEIPRLKRSQPDVVALAGWKMGEIREKPYMDAVPFNHEIHETAADSCKTCHHGSMKKCIDCHVTAGGIPEGDFVGLEAAMHKSGTDRSCIGCHGMAAMEENCSGCHFMMRADRKDPESCRICHSLKPEQLDASDPVQLAREAMAARSARYTSVADEKIPEIVTISVLADEYQPSRFPHRKVVRAVFQRAEKSGMAKTFHQDQAGMCMGCHHNSPRSLEPPKCASCHSKAGPDPSDGRPGLKGAYHGQCIGCHQQMKVESVAATDCAKCHEEKK